MRKFKWWFLMIVIMTVGVIIRWGWNDEDVIFGGVDEKGVRLVSISWNRGIVSELVVKPEVRLWVPYGPGWYRADSVAKLLRQEKKEGEVKQLFFYNFGVMPRFVIWENTEEWDNKMSFLKGVGWREWLRYKFGGDGLRWMQEEVGGGVDDVGWDEIIPRDMANSDILRSDIRLSLFNTSGVDGLANWLANRLERGGYGVLAVGNYGSEVNGCLIKWASGVDESVGGKQLKEAMRECQIEKDEMLGANEVEIYFGRKWAQMLNYESY